MLPRIVHLSRMVIPPSRILRVLGLFASAHFDESGTHKGSLYTVMAGYVASEGQWAALDWDWKNLLSAFELESFHAHEFYHRTGPFKHLTKTGQAAFEEAALALLDRSTLFSIAVGLVNKDHNEYRKDPGIKYYRHSHYGLCFHHCVANTASMMRQHFNGAPVAFVLEAGHQNDDDVVRIFNGLKFGQLNRSNKHTDIAPWLGSLSFDRGLSSLEAADMLAYRTYRQMVAGEFRTNKRIGNAVKLFINKPFFRILRPALVKTKEEMAAYSRGRRDAKKSSSQEQPS
jgi:hypothetical protein